MDYLFEALANGTIKSNKKPGGVKIIKLTHYLENSLTLVNLCKSIAYSMTVPEQERRSKIWQVTKNSWGGNKNWSNIAVLSLVTNPSTLKDLLAVDFSILNHKDKEQLLIRYPKFKEELIYQLSILIRNSN